VSKLIQIGPGHAPTITAEGEENTKWASDI
jgi:hypothetical protein